jgi:hypothetical protein
MPNEKAVKEISKLTAILNELRRDGATGFCLYVGTRSSVTAEGRPATEELRSRVLSGRFGAGLSEEELTALAEQRREDEFTSAWARQLIKIRSLIAREVSIGLPITDGHLSLAKILDMGCFNLVITSNTDTLIEDALLQAGVLRARWRVLFNGLHSPAFIRDTLLNPGCDFVILKLCGDVLNSGIYSMSLSEIEKSVPPLAEEIEPFLSPPMVLVGYGLIDDHIFKWFPKQRDIVYYIGTGKPPGDWDFYDFFPGERRVDIIDDDLTFESFCNMFAQRLSVFHNVEAYGLPVTSSVVERVAGDAQESELLVELIDTGQTPPLPEQPAEGAEPLVVIMPSQTKNTVFTVKFDNRQQLSFDVKGKISYESVGAETWRVDVDDLNTAVSDLGRDIMAYYDLNDEGSRVTWRRRAKREGRRLYDDLLRSHDDLGKQLAVARQITKQPEVLTLNFVGPRNYLGMPYELLHDNNVPLTVKYPLCRQVSGVAANRAETFGDFVQSLARDGKPLRVLLIASDTGGITADDEVRELHGLWRAGWTGPPGVVVDQLTTQEASFSEVVKLLENCSHHVVHLAGHATFDPQCVEESGLLFYEKKGRSGKIKVLTARRVAQLMGQSRTMLCYLSCCVGAMVGGGHLLHDYDYLGLMDAIVHAGVPYVLGYRWYVTDSGSRRFATSFYEKLLDFPHAPESATLHARRQAYGDDGNDETWTSPILVAQNIRG